ncbi:MAG: FmdB family zinc ribbon protein, partial [Candidatus Helarchaeota archaeon]
MSDFLRDSTVPIFEYRCNKCGHTMEFLEKTNSPRKHTCDKCNSSDVQ